MFRIRRIQDALLPINRNAIEQVQAIVRAQFHDLDDWKIREIPEKLHNPMKYDFRSVLFVCDDRNGRVKGFAQFSAEPEMRFGFLDLIALSDGSKGGGLGAALYERVQEECVSLGFNWLFFECLTDLPQYNQDPAELRLNRRRLRFYERLGARPVLGTLYERPRQANHNNAYFLMVDDLGRDESLEQAYTMDVVQAILRRKYKKKMAEKIIQEVKHSFTDDPVALRPSAYLSKRKAHVYPAIPSSKKIFLCITQGHSIHHIKDRGYAELPVRVSSILDELNKTDLFETVPSKHVSDKYILAVHARRLFTFFKTVALSIEPEQTLFPDVFPIRKNVGQPRNVRSHAGYYCIDVYSPINRNAYLAARDAVDVAMTAAKAIEQGNHFAYALVRPPGHHAGYDSFGGYCYFNSTAIAANYLAKHGRVAILDLDYHHGNGQQEIFYRRNDVLTLSIHADPSFEYPYFSGYSEELGEEIGRGYNLNLPMRRGIDGAQYMPVLKKARKKIREFQPEILVIALGLDTAQNDPSGTWNLVSDDFYNNGFLVGEMGYPTLVVQEGGYDCSVLGKNALAFLQGMWNAYYQRLIK